MKKRALSVAPLFGLVLAFTACGGGGGNDQELFDFSGRWNARFNFSADGCSLVQPDIPGFMDEQLIVQQEDRASFQSASGFVDTQDASVIGGHLEAETVIEGDVLGTGVFCSSRAAVSYDAVSGDAADALFSFSIICADGTGCESAAIGKAERQPMS